MIRACVVSIGLVALAAIGGVAPAVAQEGIESGEEGCTVLCQPELALKPAVGIGPLTQAPRTVSFEGGQPIDTTRGGLETSFSLGLGVEVPTQWNRLTLEMNAVWTPFADASGNPFTGETGSVTENPVEFVAEAGVAVLRAEDTAGWSEVNVVVADQLGPAVRPDADRWYTHKLGLGLKTVLFPFNGVEEADYLRSIAVEGAIEYQATGRLRAGDRFPEELVLDDASPWGGSVVLVFPIAPLHP